MEGVNIPAVSIPAFRDLVAKDIQDRGQTSSDSAASASTRDTETTDFDGKDKNKHTPTRTNVHPPAHSRATFKARRKPKQWIFGLPRSQNAASDQVLNQDDCEQKYPADTYCEELGPNARIYKVYIDEAAKYDDEVVDSWRDNLDVLLVFAGLFSAVVTTFVVESSSKLGIDWSEMNARLLAESIAVQRALAAGSPLSDVPGSKMTPDMDFIPQTADRWINGLWFVSLGCSLSAALSAVLVKQWIKHYRSTIVGSARDRAHITQSRREALERGKVPTIVGLLPVLLHISLYMFFFGLAVFVYPLDQPTFCFITITLALSLVAYVITTLLPLVSPQCSYVTPLTSVVYSTLQSLRIQGAFIRPTFHLLKLKVLSWIYEFDHNLHYESFKARRAIEDLWRTPFHHISELERKSVEDASAIWDTQVLVWLQSATSLHPTVSPILLQAIAGLPVDFPQTLFPTLLQVNIHHSYPSQVKPWMGLLIGSEHQDPRQFYYEREQATAERYMRACVQFNARLYNSLTWTDDRFDRTHGALLFSLPCIYYAWEGMARYGNECEYIRNLCATAWQKAELPRHQSHCSSRFALIFTAFLRYQASADKDDAQRLHPVIWEQMLLYIINFLSPKTSVPASAASLPEGEKAFLRRSGQDIFYMMLRAMNPNNLNHAVPIFAIRWQFPDGGIQELNKPEAMRQPTSLFKLPRRYYLLRYLALSTALGSNVQRSSTPLELRIYLAPNETDFIQRLPECYFISLMQLLSFPSFSQTLSDSRLLSSEILSCTFYITHFFKDLDQGKINYTTAEAEYASPLDPTVAQEWILERKRSYILTVRYALEKLSAFICAGEYATLHKNIQKHFIVALSMCDLCLRTIDPDGPFLPFTPTLINRLLDYMSCVPSLEQREDTNANNIWIENSVFDLLWRSLKDGNPPASEVFVQSNCVMTIVYGLQISREQTFWNDTQFEYYTLPVAVVLLGFIQGFLSRRMSESTLSYLSSPLVFPALCGVLFPAFLAQPSYRTKIEPHFLDYNLEIMWHALLELTRMDTNGFREAWKEVFRRKIRLVQPQYKRDYDRVEDLKELLGLVSDPQYVQLVEMKAPEIPSGLLEQLQCPRTLRMDPVQLDYRFVRTYLNENMELCTDPQQSCPDPTPPARSQHYTHLEPLVTDNGELSTFGALGRLGIAMRRFRSAASWVSQV